MAIQYTQQRLRFLVNTDVKFGGDAVKEVFKSRPLLFARNSGLRIEVAFFSGDTLMSIDNIGSVTLEVKRTNSPSAALAMSQTIGVDSMRKGLTTEEWESGEPDMAHFVFIFVSGETADANFGTPDDSATHWMSLSGFTLDNVLDRDVFGVAPINSFNAGISGATPTPPATGTAATFAEISSLMQDFLKKINAAGTTLTLTSPNGVKKLKIGVDDNGDMITETQTSS